MALGTWLGKLRHLRLRWLLRQAEVKARLLGASVAFDVAPDVRLGSGVTFQIEAGSTNTVRLGPGCRILDDVAFQLKGGTIDFGPRVEVRRGSTFNVSGTLRCAGGNIFSYGNVVHCASSIFLDEYASTNEFVSIIDSTHHHDGDAAFFYENTSAAPISIGKNTWICNKASVLMGVTVGNNAVVASHAVVNRDVPSATVVAGLPAKVVAERRVAGPALEFFTPEELAERTEVDRTPGS